MIDQINYESGKKKDAKKAYNWNKLNKAACFTNMGFIANDAMSVS